LPRQCQSLGSGSQSLGLIKSETWYGLSTMRLSLDRGVWRLDTSGSIPTGLRPTAQGCRTRLPWDGQSAIAPNPNGVASIAPNRIANKTWNAGYRYRMPQPLRG